MITYGAKFLSDHRKSMQNMDFFNCIFYPSVFIYDCKHDYTDCKRNYTDCRFFAVIPIVNVFAVIPIVNNSIPIVNQTTDLSIVNNTIPIVNITNCALITHGSQNMNL